MMNTVVPFGNTERPHLIASLSSSSSSNDAHAAIQTKMMINNNDVLVGSRRVSEVDAAATDDAGYSSFDSDGKRRNSRHDSFSSSVEDMNNSNMFTKVRE